jgi:hypothetical protein
MSMDLTAPRPSASPTANSPYLSRHPSQVPEGENVFGVAHIYASFNDTFVHVTDISGK